MNKIQYRNFKSEESELRSFKDENEQMVIDFYEYITKYVYRIFYI